MESPLSMAIGKLFVHLCKAQSLSSQVCPQALERIRVRKGGHPGRHTGRVPGHLFLCQYLPYTRSTTTVKLSKVTVCLLCLCAVKEKKYNEDRVYWSHYGHPPIKAEV